MIIVWSIFEWKLNRKIFTGAPGVHGDDAVAALDNELVDPYLLRPGKEVSLNVSDGTTVRENVICLNDFKIVWCF